MGDIKTDFKKWLQENYSKSSAYSYYSLVQKIFDKNFGVNQDWQQYSESVIPLLVRYFEFANREYYLDRVTIWYALDYFEKIAGYLQSGHLKSTKPDVDLYIFDGDKNYYVCSVGITELYDNVVFIQRYLFENTDDLQYNDENLSVDAHKLVILLENIKETGKLQDLRDAAIHIIYNNPNNSAEKTALSRYSDFLYALTANSAFDYKANPFVYMAKNESPNNMIGGNYYISQPITGKQPLQIIFKDNTCGEYLHDGFDNNDDKDEEKEKENKNVDGSKEYIPDFILIVSDMVDILHIDRKSVVKHFVDKKFIKNMKPDAEKIEKEYDIAKDKTVLRTYFSISSTNEFLKNHHHSVYKKGYPVNYNKEGYADENKKDYWIQQSKTIKELTISRNAFSDLITEYNCSYIDYIKGYPRYYDEDIQYLKTTRLIIEAQRRKRLYLRKNKKIKTN